MKILHILKTTNGAEWAFKLICKLKDLGHEVYVMLPDADNGKVKRYEAAGVKTVILNAALPVRNFWKFPAMRKAFRKAVAEISPDIIHTHFVTNTLFVRLAMRKKGPARLFQIPGPLHLESCFFRYVDVLSATGNDFWAGSCKRSCEYLQSAGVARDRIFLNYYGGYGGEYCDRYEDPTGILHSELDLSCATPLVGMVSYIYPPKHYLGQTRGIKGHEDFADAMQKVLAAKPEVRGVIIGDLYGKNTAYRNKVHKYVQEKCGGKVYFTGFRTDLFKVYRELSVAVHPSHSENLGGAAESLAAGVPTVSTDVGGFPDIVINGKTGLTCPAQSPDALADAILKMLDDKSFAQETAAAGRANVRTLLDIATTAGETSAIYQKITKSGSKNE